MKIKKFNNKWTMGLIIFATILIALYLLKFIFPEFVVGVAQIPEIVAFGTYVDSHWWAYYLFTFVVSFATYYIYCCACCRCKSLKLNQCGIIALATIILFLLQKFLPIYYFGLNMIIMFILPTIINYMSKNEGIKYLYSTCIVYLFHNFCQLFSLAIRDIQTLISYPNSATFTILLIDGYILLGLLYNYFNYKESK